MILNTDDIRKQRPNEGLILNLRKSPYSQFLSKTFGGHVEISMAFKTLKK